MPEHYFFSLKEPHRPLHCIGKGSCNSPWQDAPLQCLTARGSAHDGTNLLHRGQQTYSEPPLWQVVAHGELQELPLPAFPSDGIVLALAGCAFPSRRRDLASGIPVPLAAGASKSRPLCCAQTFFLYYAIPYASSACNGLS